MDKRIIFHIDVNNAFLSWTAIKMLKEGYERDIRKIPAIIGGDESKRHGIVLAKSPVAKKYGIKTAETIYSAKKKCANLEIFPSDYQYYSKISKKFFQHLAKYSPNIEKTSVDECYIDMTGTKFLYANLEKLAYDIKEEVKEKFGFTVNIGIANNKLCAKMASDFEKPDRIHTLYEDEVKNKMWPLDVGKLFMVGEKSATKLKKLGINTIGDLATSDTNMLTKYFKSQGIIMWKHANGIDESPVEYRKPKNKGISTSETLSTDVGDKNKLKKILMHQTEKVCRDIRRKKLYTTTIAVTMKTHDFVSSSKQMTLDNPTNSTDEISQCVMNVFDSLYDGEKIRNIGVRLSNLSPNNTRQISIFNEKRESDDKIQNALDEINDKFGSSSVIKASLLDSDK